MQQQAIQERARLAAEERARQLALAQERARRAANLQRVQLLKGQLEALESRENNEPDYFKRMREVQEILDLEKQFAQAEEEYLATLPSYFDRLAESLDLIHVPPPHGPDYDRILIWGLWSTPEEAAEAEANGEPDPFSRGKNFDGVFAFGSKGAGDLLRVAEDHFLALVNQLSPATSAQLERLKGATAHEVVCHSNGCRVAEVLIATGALKVDRLRILGGDNAMLDTEYLKRLSVEKHVDITVYAIKHDVVTCNDPYWGIMDRMEQLGRPLKTFQESPKAHDYAYQMMGLCDRPAYDPASPVKFHVFSSPAPFWNPVKNHVYSSYSGLITGLNDGGCLEEDGSLKSSTIITPDRVRLVPDPNSRL